MAAGAAAGPWGVSPPPLLGALRSIPLGTGVILESGLAALESRI